MVVLRRWMREPDVALVISKLPTLQRTDDNLAGADLAARVFARRSSRSWARSRDKAGMGTVLKCYQARGLMPGTVDT
jgi:hypothetical protein